jgi:hypothetical protein
MLRPRHFSGWRERSIKGGAATGLLDACGPV